MLQSTIILRAVAIALGSSVDNFGVGLSLGVAEVPLRVWMNATIALSNALGAFSATYVGSLLGRLAPELTPWLAASVFAYLAIEEYRAWRHSRPSSLVSMASKGAGQSSGGGRCRAELLPTAGGMCIVLQLAVPMTLNNLAGGVAGGVSGVGPATAFASAFGASFGMMLSGNLVGRLASTMPIDPRVAAGSIFAALAVSQVAGEVVGLAFLGMTAASLVVWHSFCESRLAQAQAHNSVASLRPVKEDSQSQQNADLASPVDALLEDLTADNATVPQESQSAAARISLFCFTTRSWRRCKIAPIGTSESDDSA
mmetsp:Transcript_66984/g.111273  ORF Transcript_66984/g.111273 Transcript_66984/m.111273 type:complete len:312 (-) Transcript_66984:50-985(-)